jgi:hypothetical protein
MPYMIWRSSGAAAVHSSHRLKARASSLYPRLWSASREKVASRIHVNR